MSVSRGLLSVAVAFCVVGCIEDEQDVEAQEQQSGSEVSGADPGQLHALDLTELYSLGKTRALFVFEP